jgi:hypothetical protein
MTAALLLLAAQTIAAPIPEPFAVLDLGPPPKGKSAEEHRKRIVTYLTSRSIVPHQSIKEDGYGGASLVVSFKKDGPVPLLSDPEVRKLPAVAKMSAEETETWLRTNLKVAPDSEVGRIRMKFGAGSRAERVVVLNGLLRAHERLRVKALTDKKERIRVNKVLVDSYRGQLQRANAARSAEIEKSLKAAKNEIRDGEQAVERLQKAGVRKWAK